MLFSMLVHFWFKTSNTLGTYGPVALLSLTCQAYESLLLDERLSAPSALDNNGPCDDVIHSPVVLEEEECDEDGKEEGNGEVFI